MHTAPHPAPKPTSVPAPDALLLGQWLAEPGHVHIAALRREPYAWSADWGLTDVRALTSAEAADLLSAPSSARTASTSAFEGLLSTLSAMAAAVRNRSYVLMAANSSDSGALARLNLSSLASKASTAFLDGMSISILEIDHCATGQGGSESDRTNSSSAAPAPAGNSALPAIGAPLDGGQFAGVISQPNGTVTAVVLLPGHAENLTFAQAKAWAKQQGGQLPSRLVAALLYAHMRGSLQPEYHWTSEIQGASYAWHCYFYYGTQYFNHKSWQACAVAVRLIPFSA